MKTSTAKISLFVLTLGVGIFFLRSGKHPSTPAPLSVVPGLVGGSTPRLLPNKAFVNSSSSQETVVTPRGPSSAPSRGATAEKESLKAQLQAEKICYRSESCHFPKTDPKSYRFALGRKIAEDLGAFQKNFAHENPEEARSLALEFSSNDDGFVQEASLKILNELPPTAESLKAVTQVVTTTTDPSIVPQALGELKRYVGTAQESQVHEALGTLLSTGGLLASQQASQGLLPFINATSVGYYQKILQTLPPGSEAARNLKISLQEYQRRSTGG
jgi:hypothetical protein